MIQLGIIGYPLDHSLSPKIHATALKLCGLQGDYALFPVKPDKPQGLEELLTRVYKGDITGLNVTIPYKQSVIPLLDELSPIAQTIRAVNTIYMKDGKLIGDNTDASGFMVDLNNFLTFKISGNRSLKNVLVLGAGGSARAAIFALAKDGWNISIASRRSEQARVLIEQIQVPTSRISSIEYQPAAIQPLLPTLDLVVNTTPIGMFPNIENSPWPASQPFPPQAAVYDLIYKPRETKFIRDAHAARLHAISGFGMLIEQAALAFEIWTGCNVPREPLLAVLEEL